MCHPHRIAIRITRIAQYIARNRRVLRRADRFVAIHRRALADEINPVDQVVVVPVGIVRRYRELNSVERRSSPSRGQGIGPVDSIIAIGNGRSANLRITVVPGDQCGFAGRQPCEPDLGTGHRIIECDLQHFGPPLTRRGFTYLVSIPG